MNLMKKVEKCKFSRFCERWGEYKCARRYLRLNPEFDCVECKDYVSVKRGDPEAKEGGKTCHCSTCLKYAISDKLGKYASLLVDNSIYGLTDRK